MDFDLTHQFLFGSRLGQCCLINYFGSLQFPSFSISELIALGESTLSEELSSDIFLDANVAVKSNNLLLYNDGITLIVHHVTFSA